MIGNEQPGGQQLAEPDALVQLLDANGTVVRSIANQPSIPVDEADKDLAAHGGPPRLRTATIDGTEYRILTTALEPDNGGAAQIARSIEGTNNVLSTLDIRLLLIALAGTAVAAALAWLIARRIVRPVEQLTDAAEEIAQTQKLDQHIEIVPTRRARAAGRKLQHDAGGARLVARATATPGHGREP